MYAHLKFLIKWPSQEVCRANMPQVFKDLYPHTRCIIDCSKIFIERPCSYQLRAQTYSNYKKHNTVKFMIGITPCGAISYLSKCWGGRATDKCITMNSDFLGLLEYGNIVLAVPMILPFMVPHSSYLPLPEVKNNSACKRSSAHRKLPRFKYMLSG